MSISHFFEKYRQALSTLPAPGTGGGYHAAILGAANLGIMAGITPADVAADIRTHTAPGGRNVTDGEIRDAVTKAITTGYSVGANGTPERPLQFRTTPARPSFDPKKIISGITARADADGIAEGDLEAMIFEASPIRLGDTPENDGALLLSTLYGPEDVLFIGDRTHSGFPGRTIRPVRKWLLEDLPAYGPYVMPNPLSGEQGKTKNGGPTFRGDDCIRAFRFAVLEFDTWPRAEQLRFFWGADLPISALIDTGKRSVHGWIMIDGVTTAAEWSEYIERRLFSHFGNLGADRNCKNESRLSRLPGVVRKETGEWQRLLYLAPRGRRIRG